MPETRRPSRARAVFEMLVRIVKHLHACKQQSLLT